MLLWMMSSRGHWLEAAKIPSHLEPSDIFRADGKRPDWSVHRSMETGQSPGVGFHMPRHFGPLLRTPCNKRSRSCGNRDGAQEEHEVCPPERHSPLCPHSKWNLWDDGTRSKALLSVAGQGITAATLDLLSNQHLLQRVSIAVQHGNAAALLGTLPQGSLRS